MCTIQIQSLAIKEHCFYFSRWFSIILDSLEKTNVCRQMSLHVLKQITLTTINVYLHWGSGLTMVAVSWDLELVHTSNESTSDLQVLCHQNVLYLWNRNTDYQDVWIYELYQWNRNTYYQDGWISKKKDYFPTFWHIWFRPHFFNRQTSTQWVLWLKSHQLQLHLRTFPGAQFRLGQPGSSGQFLKYTSMKKTNPWSPGQKASTTLLLSLPNI